MFDKSTVDTTSLVAARNTLWEQAQEALKEHPAYKAMLAIDAVLADLNVEAKAPDLNGVGTPALNPAAAYDAHEVSQAANGPEHQTIISLALECIHKAGRPMNISKIFAYVDGAKKYADKTKARVNVVSTLSKSKKVKSLKWRGEHAWWPTDMPPPGRHVVVAPPPTPAFSAPPVAAE